MLSFDQAKTKLVRSLNQEVTWCHIVTRDTVTLTPAHHAHIVCVEYVPESLGGTLQAWSILEGDNYIWKERLNSFPLQERTRRSAADARFHSCLNIAGILLNQSCAHCCCFSGDTSAAGRWRTCPLHAAGFTGWSRSQSCCRHVDIWLLWYYLLMMAAAATKSNQSTAARSGWWNGPAADSHIWMQDFTGSIFPRCVHQDHAVMRSLISLGLSDKQNLTVSCFAFRNENLNV